MPHDFTSNPPDTFVSEGRTFFLTEVHDFEREAALAAHEYAHEGYYFRLVPSGPDEWLLYTAPGRQTQLTCCSTKRSYVHHRLSKEATK